MENLIKRLKILSKEMPIEKNFNWDIPELPTCKIKIPKDKGNYCQNIYLKENFYKALENDESLENHYWIIQKWGGITSLKQNDKNNDKIQKFKDQLLNKKKLTKKNFSTISSLSKIASFMDHKEYTIYDSRTIYSLNWLLFNFTDQTELYPQPTGRNKDLSTYDLQTIFNLSDKDYNYKSRESAYFDYCNLLKELSKGVFEEEDKPYKIEILLFLIAPTKIINCIKSKTNININPEV